MGRPGHGYKRGRVRRWSWFLAYHHVAKHLPVSSYPGGHWATKARRAAGRRLLRSAGREINIEHGADFGWGDTVSVGDRSGIGVDAWIRADLSIGKNVMMGPQAMIYGRDHVTAYRGVPMMDQGMGPYVPIVIEDDVWIGGRVTILKGVRVGAGSIIGAGSVVTRDVLPGSIVAGNPAKVVRMRDPRA